MRRVQRHSHGWLLVLALLVGIGVVSLPASASVPDLSAKLVKDINPGGSSYPAWGVNLNGTIFFEAQGGENGGLWASDGTGAGTRLVKEIPMVHLVAMGQKLFFQGEDDHGREIWESDGTPSGTRLLKDVNPGGDAGWDGGESWLTVSGSTLFFVADDGVHGSELWKSDGTAEGTVMVKDVVPWNNFGFERFANVGGTLFFGCGDPLSGAGLWKSDGTEAGTVFVKEVDRPSDLTDVDGRLFFVGGDYEHGRELWTSDGSEAGTKMVKDINPGWDPGSPLMAPYSLTNVNGTLFFAADDGVHGQEPWKSDGTEAGTSMIKDVNPTGSGFSAEDYGMAVGNLFFFLAWDDSHGGELWMSDGTGVGTTMVRDINPKGSSYAYNLVAAGDTLYFVADDGIRGYELWKTVPSTDDVTAPVLTVPAKVSADATFPAGAYVTYTVTATDDLDPNPPVVCAPVSGSLFGIGVTTVTCTATDASGNSSTGRFLVHVKDATEQLRDLTALVNGLGPPATPQVKSGLNVFLRSALSAVETNQPDVAVSYLTTFIRQVGELSKPPRPSLSITQAQMLTSSAKRIKTVLGY